MMRGMRVGVWMLALSAACCGASAQQTEPGAAAAAQPLKVSAVVMERNRIGFDLPHYPSDATAAQVQGPVVLRAVIATDGTVRTAEVVSGPEALREAAVKEVQTWHYQPYLVDGKAVEVETQVTVDFLPPLPHGTARIGEKVSPPRLVRSVEPVITVEARAGRFKGYVLVYLVVDVDGLPKNVRVVKPMGMGLDEAAMTAVKQYRFVPAMRNGEPVPIELSIEVDFEVY